MGVVINSIMIYRPGPRRGVFLNVLPILTDNGIESLPNDPLLPNLPVWHGFIS